MNINRREVLKGGLATLGFMALDGLPVFAARHVPVVNAAPTTEQLGILTPPPGAAPHINGARLPKRYLPPLLQQKEKQQ